MKPKAQYTVEITGMMERAVVERFDCPRPKEVTAWPLCTKSEQTEYRQRGLIGSDQLVSIGPAYCVWCGLFIWDNVVCILGMIWHVCCG